MVGQQIAVAAAQRQQARAEGAKLASDLTELEGWPGFVYFSPE